MARHCSPLQLCISLRCCLLLLLIGSASGKSDGHQQQGPPLDATFVLSQEDRSVLTTMTESSDDVIFDVYQGHHIRKQPDRQPSAQDAASAAPAATPASAATEAADRDTAVPWGDKGGVCPDNAPFLIWDYENMHKVSCASIIDHEKSDAESSVVITCENGLPALCFLIQDCAGEKKGPWPEAHCDAYGFSGGAWTCFKEIGKCGEGRKGKALCLYKPKPKKPAKKQIVSPRVVSLPPLKFPASFSK